MKINKLEDSAILFISELARSSSVMPLSWVSARHGISLLFLKKIARSLRRAGLIKSKEGIGGGYLLCTRAKRITVWDVLMAVNPVKHNVPAVIQNRVKCPLIDQCLPQALHVSLSRAIEKHLQKMTIQDLIS